MLFHVGWLRQLLDSFLVRTTTAAAVVVVAAAAAAAVVVVVVVVVAAAAVFSHGLWLTTGLRGLTGERIRGRPKSKGRMPGCAHMPTEVPSVF